MTECRMEKDPETGISYLVPGCTNRAVYGDDADCYCPEKSYREAKRNLAKWRDGRIKDLEAELAELKGATL